MPGLALQTRWVAGGVAGVAGLGLGFQAYRFCFEPPPTGFDAGLGLGGAYYRHGKWVRSLTDPELSHLRTVKVMSMSRKVRAWCGLVEERPARPSSLQISTLGLKFDCAIGSAAGFDKDAECIDGMLDAGFGFVEIGSVTPEPQPGNPKPRVFRLEEDEAVVNRYGFNSQGHAVVRARLETRWTAPAGDKPSGVVGVNLGKNKLSADACQDYVLGVQRLGPFADYLVINVSSPNTPGLRDMQAKEELRGLLTQVKTARDQLPRRPPVLVKVAPDVSDEAILDMAEVVLATGIDGIIVSNTTVARDAALRSPNKGESGGLSGRPLMASSTEVLSKMYAATKGQVPLVGVGGVSCAADAYAKIRAGASLVQLYTGFAFQGPMLVHKIKEELPGLLAKDGFSSVEEAVGVDVDWTKMGAPKVNTRG